MANPPQPNIGYSTLSNPNSLASQTKTPIPPPLVSPAKFPSPSFRQDQAPSPSNGSPISQLSTPPGPPVFTSPVRPAAVPFRASPVTPQPLAFSSPPHFSNGSVDFQHQVSDVGESPYVLFSAHKVFLSFLALNQPSFICFNTLITLGFSSI